MRGKIIYDQDSEGIAGHHGDGESIRGELGDSGQDPHTCIRVDHVLTKGKQSGSNS